ncbi:unnamed protein product [Echinostoma caproni]|uniref:Reverse transcriptase domain-containing protein n=1 Tax=Echinostoma caproni TaxID=27848 RepID=A0A183AT96_9TREM|nr:unnamed protein product [Echinostoma caproni]
MYVQTVLDDKKFREMWNNLRELCGSRISSFPNVEVLNRQLASVPASSSLPPPFLAHDAINPVSPDEVLQVLRRIKANKAHGPDELAPHLLKACADQLATPIAELFTTWCHLERSSIVDQPGSDRSQRKDRHRTYPIAYTSALLKDFENVLPHRMIPQCNSHDPLQFAYQSHLSTLDAVAHIVHFVASVLDNGAGSTCLTFLDHTNAFGSLDQSVLIDRLFECGITHEVLNVLINYPFLSTQFNSLNSVQSSTINLEAGVFQGAILFPFLVFTYIKNLPIPTNFIACKYADDIVIGCPAPIPDSFRPLQDSLNELHDWSVTRSLVPVSALKFHLVSKPVPIS